MPRPPCRSNCPPVTTSLMFALCWSQNCPLPSHSEALGTTIFASSLGAHHSILAIPKAWKRSLVLAILAKCDISCLDIESKPFPGSFGSQNSVPVTSKVLFSGDWPGSFCFWCGNRPVSRSCLYVSNSVVSASTNLYVESGWSTRGCRYSPYRSLSHSRSMWLRGWRKSCSFCDQRPNPGLMSRMSHPLCFSNEGPMYLRTSSIAHDALVSAVSTQSLATARATYRRGPDLQSGSLYSLLTSSYPSC